MRIQQTIFRLTAAAAIGGLALGPLAAPFAAAQTDTPPAQDSTAAGQAVDPPSRVGRLAAISGTVSFHTADDITWQDATANYPVTSGNYFWTEPLASAVLEVGPTHLVLDQQTEFDVNTLDDHNFLATIPQGEAYLRLRDVAPGDTTTVTTPRGDITVTAAGRYAITAGNTDAPTLLTVVDGAADIVVGTVTLHVTAHQTATITGSEAADFRGSVAVEADDPFLSAQLAKEHPPATATAAVAYQPPPLVEKMTGYDAIADSGEWAPTPQYGHVWFPPVQRDWVPYRHGHWAFVHPWGWTWVDDAAWGFAPFHYGRWVQVDNRWAWTPLDPNAQVNLAVAQPVYAPALVSFVDVGGAAAGVAVGVAAGLALGASVGWIPLGPREVYHPAFNASPAYFRRVNVTHVTNVSQITTINNTTINNTTINNYANRSAVTLVPAAAMTSSRPIAAVSQKVTPQMLAAVRPVATAPVRPTAATAGYVPAAARAPAAPGTAAVPPRPAAPGPAITARPAAVAPAGAKPGLSQPAHLPGLKPPAAATPAATKVIPAAAPAKPQPAVPSPAASAAEPAHPAAEAEKPAIAKPAITKPPVAPAKPAAEAVPAKPGVAPAAAEPRKPAPAPAVTAKPVAPKPEPKASVPPQAKPAEPKEVIKPQTAAPAAHVAPAAAAASHPAAPAVVMAHPAPTPAPHPVAAAAAHDAKPPAHPAEKPKACPGGKETC